MGGGDHTGGAAERAARRRGGALQPASVWGRGARELGGVVPSERAGWPPAARK